MCLVDALARAMMKDNKEHAHRANKEYFTKTVTVTVNKPAMTINDVNININNICFHTSPVHYGTVIDAISFTATEVRMLDGLTDTFRYTFVTENI